MEGDVLVDESGDEEVGVVVAGLVLEVEALADGVARGAEGLGLELVDVADEEVVVGALGDEDVAEGEVVADVLGAVACEAAPILSCSKADDALMLLYVGL